MVKRPTAATGDKMVKLVVQNDSPTKAVTLGPQTSGLNLK